MAAWPRPGPGALFRKGFPGQPNDFDRTQDATRILTVDVFVGDGIARGEFGEKFGTGNSFELAAKLGIGGRRFSQTFEKRFEVKAGAATQNGKFAPAMNVRHGLLGQGDKLRRVESLGQADDVDEMMWHPLAFGQTRFAGADIEPAINLHGVHGNDFAVKLFSEKKRYLGFAGRGSAGDEEGLNAGRSRRRAIRS